MKYTLLTSKKRRLERFDIKPKAIASHGEFPNNFAAEDIKMIVYLVDTVQ